MFFFSLSDLDRLAGRLQDFFSCGERGVRDVAKLGVLVPEIHSHLPSGVLVHERA